MHIKVAVSQQLSILWLDPIWLIIIIGIILQYIDVINGHEINFELEERCISPAGLSGECIQIKQCPKILNVIESAPRPLSEKLASFLRQHHCGFDADQQPKVCCEIGVSTRHDTDTNIAKHKNIDLLPLQKCGPIWTNKISGGNKTDLFEYPWMALLQYQTFQGLNFECGGSLINEKYILTAAHCVTTLPDGHKLTSVRLGEHDISKSMDCQEDDDYTICAEPVQDIDIEDVIVHPDYGRPRWANDIALIRLARPANMTPESVRPICLPVTNELLNLTPRRVSISGWGTTENQTTSNELLQASLPTISNEQCQQFFKRSIRIMPSQLCAGGEKGVDSCKGDSGGPLVYPATLLTTQMVQFGIVSVGIESCRLTTEAPAVYTRVGSFMSWLLDQLKL